jgi:PPM family protein phosphatase
VSWWRRGPRASEPVALDSAHRTHVGKVRSHNEDALVDDPERGVFAVIDGMGGQRAGEVAADLARQTVLGAPGDEGLARIVGRANEVIHRQSEENPEHHGMGCVATVARVAEDEIELAHVGDTRAYLARSAGCVQLTRDHTPLADLEDDHGLLEDEAEKLTGRHRVNRNLGHRLYPDDDWIDHLRVPFDDQDLLLLCSDGLTDMLESKEICDRLLAAREQGGELAALTRRLVERTLEQGARDNVTVVAVRLRRQAGGAVAEVEEPEADEPEGKALDATQKIRPVPDGEPFPSPASRPGVPTWRLVLLLLLLSTLIGLGVGWWLGATFGTELLGAGG